MENKNSQQIENNNEEEADGRTFVMLGQFTSKVYRGLPLELSYETTERISELIFDDLNEQGLVPGRCVNIAMDSILCSPERVEDALRLRRTL